MEERHDSQVVGRTFVDLIYDFKWYILIALLIISYFVAKHFGIEFPTVPYIYVVPAAAIGAVIGVLFGWRDYDYPPLVYVIKPEGSSSARLWIAHPANVTVLEPAMPIGTPYGSTIRLAREVEFQNNVLRITPHSIHKLALENPLEALAHVKALERLAEQLDDITSKYIALYVETRAKARVLARRYVNELINIERMAERAALEELKKSIKGEEVNKRCPRMLLGPFLVPNCQPHNLLTILKSVFC